MGAKYVPPSAFIGNSDCAKAAGLQEQFRSTRKTTLARWRELAYEFMSNKDFYNVRAFAALGAIGSWVLFQGKVLFQKSERLEWGNASPSISRRAERHGI
jgi:hypothetical protein